jgi:hypothetical protein
MKKAAICVSVFAIQLMACINNKKNTIVTIPADTPKTPQPTKQVIQSAKHLVIKLDTTAFYEPYFKYRNLVAFNMDKYDWENRRDHYRQLDSVAFFAINQDTEFKELPGIEEVMIWISSIRCRKTPPGPALSSSRSYRKEKTVTARAFYTAYSINRKN